jgi:hypothetical protein
MKKDDVFSSASVIRRIASLLLGISCVMSVGKGREPFIIFFNPNLCTRFSLLVTSFHVLSK